MTTFAYTVVLNDSEVIAIEAALELLIKHCDKNLKNGPRAPYYIWRVHAERIKAKLTENSVQTSGQRTDPETGETTIWIGLNSNQD